MAAMQEAMKRPEVAQQMAQMQAAMQNQQLQANIATLKVRTAKRKPPIMHPSVKQTSPAVSANLQLILLLNYAGRPRTCTHV